ncbi:hypothetical protein NLJ89_g4987 [Agrocybe chaxingu]|uniref:Uncharacterized protein n=1 Tax=Agrocybe chaxingu TaxID=84603 RepID=A0A9W8K1V7_9AGAR|nr:hypothetical protein NLJ89_g4987 [Agrocybe chaxingu]
MPEINREEAVRNMAAAARQVFGPDVVVETTPTGVRFPMGFGMAPGKPRTRRPGQGIVDDYLKNPTEGDAFLANATNDSFSRSMQAGLLRGRADKLVKAKDYGNAVRMYLSAAEKLCQGSLPTRRVRSKIYMDLELEWDAQDVMGCLTEAGATLVKMGKYAEALFWLCEALDTHRNMRFVSLKDKAAFDWFNSHIGTKQHFKQIYTTYDAIAEAYLKLGNTGTATYYQWQASVNSEPGNIPAEFQPDDLSDFKRECQKKVHKVLTYRHPDPKLAAKLEIVDPKSQVQGSWRRVEIKQSAPITSRMGAAVFVHKGYLYVAGGEKYQDGPYYRDFCRLKLSKPAKWEVLPSVPIPSSRLVSLMTFRMVVDSNDTAYYFTGCLDLSTYNIKTRKWGTFRTRSDPSWAYPHKQMHDQWQDSVVHCVNDKIYVFGGTTGASRLGTNLLLQLDLSTRVWRKLSGELFPKEPSLFCPGPRINASSWVSKEQDKIFIMYGDANRMSAKLSGQEPGATTTYAYDDLWSWDIREERWTRGKIVGNAPSPRTEMAAVYNPILDKVFTFGGYSPAVPTVHVGNNNELFGYSYYADTFICDFRPENAFVDKQKSAAGGSISPDHFPASWRQVLTRGFPTYRAQAHLLVDDQTGKTYLFSGYINTEFVPSRAKSFSRSFADLWELRLDIPGGNFDGVDLEEEARTARAGPWQRCFACGSAGPWKKCGGSCGGRVFFCGSDCLKDGWKEHKQNHNCRKV